MANRTRYDLSMRLRAIAVISLELVLLVSCRSNPTQPDLVTSTPQLNAAAPTSARTLAPLGTTTQPPFSSPLAGASPVTPSDTPTVAPSDTPTVAPTDTPTVA